MAKLQKTSVEMEGRFEERWVLVEEEPEAWEDDRELSVAGTRVPRLTGPRRVSGAARYVSDVTLPGMLHGVVVRSPHAHATVELDVAAALAVPGVHAVLSAADENVKQGRRPIFQSEPAYAGAPVAALACEDAAAARAAHRRARARATQQLGFVVDPAQALAEQRLQEDPVEDETGDVEAGMGEADVIVEGEYAHVRPGAARARAALRGRAVARRRAARVHLDAGHLRRARRRSRSAFELDPDRVHVTCEFMGGGFGAKQGPTTEGLIAAYLSRAAAGRAVRVFNDRHSEAIATGHRASTQQTLPHRRAQRRDADGDRGHLRDRESDARLGQSDHGPGAHALPLRQRARATRSRCKIDVEPSNAFRAPGVMEGTFGYESAIDELAAALVARPARAAPRQRRRRRPGQRPAVHLQAPLGLHRPRRRAGGLGRARRAARSRARRRPRPGPRRRLPDLVGRRRPAGARARAHGPRRRRHRRDGRAGHRHRRDDGVRDGRRRGARPAARPRARRGRLDALRRLRPRLGRLADHALGRAGGARRGLRPARQAARARRRRVRGLARRPAGS